MIPQNHQQFLVPAAALPAPVPLPRDEDGARFELRLGFGAAIGFFGLFLGWAAFAPLDAAVHATGSVSVSGNRQVVQNRDGGTVSILRVREGQRVRQGEVLIELAPAELEATERALTAQRFDLAAQAARLDAEQAGTATLIAPADFLTLPPADRALADAALARQRAELAARRRAVAAQKAVLSRQAAELGSRVGGIGEQIAASRRQTTLFDDELAGMRKLAAEGYASINRVRALERAREALGSDTSGLAATAAATRQQIGETRLQAASLDDAALREVAESRRQVQAQLTDLLPRLAAARAQLDRSRVRAPADGQVIGLAVSTVGAVVAPGQTLMEIVPDKARLIVTAKVAPGDADDLAVGEKTEVRLTALHDRSLPTLIGSISRLSADSFEDQRTGQRYFTLDAEVPEASLREVSRLHGSDQVMRPGMPVELLIPQRKRTLLQYLLEPLDRALWSSLREK